MVHQMLTRLAIFDLDGTLIDSIGDLADAMNAVLRNLGHPVHPRPIIDSWSATASKFWFTVRFHPR